MYQSSNIVPSRHLVQSQRSENGSTPDNISLGALGVVIQEIQRIRCSMLPSYTIARVHWTEQSVVVFNATYAFEMDGEKSQERRMKRYIIPKTN